MKTDANSRNDSYHRLLFALIAVATALLSLHIGSRALWDPDEGRYAEMGREVLALHDWLTPHLNYLLYFEKPMLFPWSEAISQGLLGMNAAAARIPPLLCALGIVALVGWMAAREWGRRAGLIAAVVLLTSVEFFLLANVVDINMPLALFITACLVCFWQGHKLERPRYYYAAWACAGLAVLTKGPIGLVIPAGIIFCYILATRRFRLIIEVRPLSGLLVFLAVAAPWYVLVCRHNPEFFNFFFINQNLERYTSTIHNRYQPFWYFGPVVIGGFLPWTFLLPEAIRRLAKKPLSDAVIFCLIWFAVTFLIFVPSQSKLATYVLPCFMPLALLIGCAFASADQEPGWLFYCECALFMILSVALLALPTLLSAGLIAYPHHHPERMALIAASGVRLGLTLLIGVCAAMLVARHSGTVPGYAIIGLTLLVFVLSFAGRLDSTRSTAELVRQLPPEAQLVAYGKYPHSAAFYARRPLYLVGSMGELTFGQAHPNRLTISREELLRRLQDRSDVFCVTEQDHLATLTVVLPNLRIVARQGDMVLVKGPGDKANKAD